MIYYLAADLQTRVEQESLLSSDSTTHRTIRTRIDRLLITQTLDQNVSKTQIIQYQHSDHDSTTLTLDLDKLKRGPGYWHFKVAP